MYTRLIITAVAAAIIAAGPLALDGTSNWRVIVWTAAIAAATYIKGKLEDTPAAAHANRNTRGTPHANR